MRIVLDKLTSQPVLHSHFDLGNNLIHVVGNTITFSGLTASELLGTDASKNLVSLAVATYPSLTELTYVKGVTSAIQTQIDTKAPSTSPTFATSITGSYLTASEILITDGSKNIISAAVATYPSLTELAYVKGVTSAIQTQLGLKAPLASPTFTGTVALPTVTLTGTITGDGTGATDMIDVRDFRRSIHNSYFMANGGTDDLLSAYLTMYGKNAGGTAEFRSPNAAKTGRVLRLTIPGAVDEGAGYITTGEGLTTGGKIGAGVASPTAFLHLKAGTATASTAPLKFTSGTNLTTPEAGAVEWDGTNLFITQTDGTRKTIAYV